MHARVVELGLTDVGPAPRMMTASRSGRTDRRSVMVECGRELGGELSTVLKTGVDAEHHAPRTVSWTSRMAAIWRSEKP